jgi:2-amino-4-hydroxy-6-hydroxymethyldihydropteridine diphosphokinase
MGKTSYALALGSNRRSRYGSPEQTVRAAIDALGAEAASRVLTTQALGPAGRRFANAAALVASRLDPPEMLHALKEMERDFGRRGGRRWGPRVLDIDVALWSGGAWGEDGLVVPHAEMRRRLFVLAPLAEIVPDWRDPVSGASVRQLLFRLKARRPAGPR